jgi:hypothetical protein
MRRSFPFFALLVTVPTLLAGCDLLGIEGAGAVAARREAEGKAIGGACRHAARSIEQCYVSNRKADKAAVFAGWREMNDYMRENKIEAMPAPPSVAAAIDEGEGAAETAASAPAHRHAGKGEPGKDGAGKDRPGKTAAAANPH